MLPHRMLLDSCHHGSSPGRFDILVAAPHTLLTTYKDHTIIENAHGEKTFSDKDPFTLIKQYTHFPQLKSLYPFAGGALGYFSYDLCRQIENIPNNDKKSSTLPLMVVGIYDWAIITDHQLQITHVVSHELHPSTEKIWPTLIKQLTSHHQTSHQNFQLINHWESNTSYQQYADNFTTIKQYITDGDCYQVNYSQQHRCQYQGSTWLAYQHMRRINPAPFAAYLDCGDHQIMSFSPERFLQLNDRQVSTSPIKGTIPRLNNPVADKKNRDILYYSEKDRAENIMIVDLLRNDLGKCCLPGSIHVTALCELKSFTNVHHLISTIVGTLTADTDPAQLLRACFPGGSITGAPKIRAMEIIDALEPHHRHIYCGSIGYISYEGKMDTNIAIRSLVAHDQWLSCAAGGAIIHDSTLASEYQETFDKINVILQGLKQFSISKNR